MTETTGNLLAYGRADHRRRRWGRVMGLGMLAVTAAVLMRVREPFGRWIDRRRSVYLAYVAEQKCLATKPGSFAPVTFTNNADQGQAVRFTAGGWSADLTDFLTAGPWMIPAGRSLAMAGARSVLAMHEVVRPDGVHRLLVVETEGNQIATYVFSVGTRLTSAELLGRQTFTVIVPPHWKLALGPGVEPATNDAVAIRMGLGEGPAKAGTAAFAIGTDDRIALKPSFGWTPPDVADTWAPGGQPAGWPDTILPAVVTLNQTGRAIAFESPTVLVVAGVVNCRRVDLTTGQVLTKFDYGSLVSDGGIGDTAVSPDGRRVVVATRPDGWFVCDPRTRAVLSTHPGESVRWLAFSGDSSRLAVQTATGLQISRSTGDPERFFTAIHASSIIAGNNHCVVGPDRGDGLSFNPRVFQWDGASVPGSRLKLQWFDRGALSAGESFLVATDQSELDGYSFPDGTQLFHRSAERDVSDTFTACRPVFLDRDRWVVAAGEKLGLYLFDLPRADHGFRIGGVDEAIDMAVSPDGKTLAVLTPTGVKLIQVADIETTAARALGGTSTAAAGGQNR